MSITDILIRSISGYVFIVPGLLLYFICLKKTNKNQMPLHIATAFVFLLLSYWRSNDDRYWKTESI